MSRTYRKRQDPFYYTNEEWSHWHVCWYGTTHYSAVAKYYTDCERGMWQIPKHWKKDFRIRPFRHAERMCIRKEIKSMEYGNVLYPVKRMFDNYYW